MKNSISKKQTILNYFKAKKKVTVDQACKDLKLTKKNLLTWLWCIEKRIEKRDADCAYFLDNGSLSVRFITK